MGFLAGFVGGATLTSSILYYSIAIHRRNRTAQCLALQQHSTSLSRLVEPEPPVIFSPVVEERVSLAEQAKDRWNGEITALVRKAQMTDWTAVQQRWEGSLASLWKRATEQYEAIKSSEGKA
ncbi:hypothetical protein EJ06DRAFT_557628 [Trichodelitschia bisporula]|uniref:MICOS complex subunit MIC12 n=1 Tax=Trichodelitschia bisporula TaxID=703511 RepID=A0A6G1HSV2_9PEZI|nr:hypothetical protein EJ06DRAFT_557628 [Trichodelitschia bisporula]